MKRFIKGHAKATGRTWSSFVEAVKSTLGYEVDSAYLRSPEQFILLYKDGTCYEGEVTRYYDGTYELICDNIHLSNS